MARYLDCQAMMESNYGAQLIFLRIVALLKRYSLDKLIVEKMN
jgi:hypothetical protein